MSGTPARPKSNIAKPPWPDWLARKPEMIRLDGVPIRVVVPPRMDAKASGISTLPGGSSRRAAIWTATGISSASAPTLFMKADSTAASTHSAAMLRVGPAPAGSTWRVSASTAPERCRPLLSTSTQATVTTAGWPRPANADAGGTSPASTQASRAPAATMSWRQRPHRNMPTVAARMARMRVWSGVIGACMGRPSCRGPGRAGRGGSFMQI